MIKKIAISLIKSFLEKKGYSIVNKEHSLVLPKKGLTYSNDYLYTYHNSDFLNDPLFNEAYRLAKEADEGILLKQYDIQWRIHVLCWAAAHASKIEGDFVDCGAGSGVFSSAISHYINFHKTEKKLYLLDTFSGLSDEFSTQEELKRSQNIYEFQDSDKKYENVKKRFSSINAKVIKGVIPETLSEVDTDKISFLSIDLNSAEPEYQALNFFWDKLVSGGIIVLDDYGYLNLFNRSKEAHDKFAKEKGVEILTLPTCQGLIIKP